MVDLALRLSRAVADAARFTAIRFIDFFKIHRDYSESHEIDDLDTAALLPFHDEPIPSHLNDDICADNSTDALNRRSPNRDLPIAIVNVLSLGWVIGLYTTYPFPTTVPLFIGGLICLTGWTSVALSRGVYALWATADRREILEGYRSPRGIGLALVVILLFYWGCLGITPVAEEMPSLDSLGNERYFIAANLYNSEGIFSGWSKELIDLTTYLGRGKVFVSIYESNSVDSTPALLAALKETLSSNSIRHRIITENTGDRWWPYATAPERIGYLAKARNRAMEPVQSDNDRLRLDNWREYTRVIFLNDVIWTVKDVARLIDTRLDGVEGYDLACAMDFGSSGLYDTWVARDICGTPFRTFWPYVKDQPTIEKVKKEEPFEVASCWNGIVTFPSGPFLHSGSGPPRVKTEPRKRGWKMIDDPTYNNSVSSPPLEDPIKFRTSGITACDHSECFLLSYDLHRLFGASNSTHPARRPRILMNPTVRVAYEINWWRWQNVVLRIGVIRWWLTHWSRGIPLRLVDWIWEAFGRHRDGCTWAGLNPPARCPKLPGPQDNHWWWI